ncbi:MAG: hypothetical protein ABW061_25395 [Polyangiaceae bacterium]
MKMPHTQPAPRHSTQLPSSAPTQLPSSTPTLRILRVCGAFAAVLLLPAPARAQGAPAANNDQYVEFIDELLNADLTTPFGDPVFAAHLPPARTLLIRPRTNFIPELYKSVEQL